MFEHEKKYYALARKIKKLEANPDEKGLIWKNKLTPTEIAITFIINNPDLYQDGLASGLVYDPRFVDPLPSYCTEFEEWENLRKWFIAKVVPRLEQRIDLEQISWSEIFVIFFL